MMMTLRAPPTTTHHPPLEKHRPSHTPHHQPTHQNNHQPNFYASKNGKSASAYLACCFVNEWNWFARNVCCSKPGVDSTCANGQLAGPAWGHVNMDTRTLEWWLR